MIIKKLYELLCKSKYTYVRHYGDKAFVFNEVNGNWEKRFTVSKYGKVYVVDGYEGLPNIIKTFRVEFNTYKEVVEYLGI